MNGQYESPCPARPRSSFGSEQYDTLTDAWGDNTQDTLEYTAAINYPPEPRVPSLTGAKPRRALKAPAFAIHEEADTKTTGDSGTTTRQSTLKRKTHDGGLSVLAQPAQRFQRPRVSLVAEVSKKSTSRSGSIRGSDEKSDVQEPPENMSRTSKKLSENDSLKKDVRRRTVYIPTEDTTMPTVFMSLFSPLKSMDNKLPSTDETVPINSLEARIAAKKNARIPSVEKPRRAPLQQTKKITQQSTIVRDMVGKNGGKENLPPGYILESKKGTCEEESLLCIKEKSRQPLEKRLSGRGTVSQPKQREKSICDPIGAKSSSALMTSINSKGMGVSLLSKQVSVQNHSTLHSRRQKEPPFAEKRPIASNKLSLPKLNPTVNIGQQYPVFTDDILNPVMYEDDWLSHQEIVITQLVNGLFDSVGGKLHVQDPETLRHELLHLYQSDSFLLLYKRLQASILYGALAPPRDMLRRGSRLPDDLGMKKSFLSFWSEIYDLNALRAAVETVVGRKIIFKTVQTSGSASETSAKQHKALKRAIESFMETFIIRNMDKEEDRAIETDITGVSYRRTILRSIMIIVLLDKTRLTPGKSLPPSLFITSSPYKSSSAALQALANLLMPSMGDINRQMNHLDCCLTYKQHQLQDYDFRINNLAVDLRDGILLTRLVEVLLYPTALHLQTQQDSHSTTISTDNKPSSEDEKMIWPLSQNLKFPCVGRAAKVFNVQIALNALKGVTGINAMVKELNADHIVDGYREKTIALLWLLVGKWGLAEMLDWHDVRNEVVRLQKKLVLCQDHQKSKVDKLCDLELTSHEDLLMKWTSALAQLKGLQLDNLTTSFADGKIFESIVDEYEILLLGGQDEYQNPSPDSFPDLQFKAEKRTLRSQLQALGCSSQFASLVADSTSVARIFDRDFILGALTFLCSRLLSLSKRIRSAIVIQTAWRRITTQQNERRRTLAKSIADQCAAVACAQERILWAKRVIVKWWRTQKAKSSKAAAPKGRNVIKKAKSSQRSRF